MRISYAPVSSNPSVFSQHSFRQSVQFRQWVDEYKRALCAPFHIAAYGSRKVCPQLVMLAKNVERESNKAAETVMTLSLGGAALAGEDAARKAPQVHSDIIAAQFPIRALNWHDLNRMETEIESLMNVVQVAMLTGDESTSRARELLTLVEKAIGVLETMRKFLRQRLYGGVQ